MAALHEQPTNSAAYRGLGLLAQRAGDIVAADAGLPALGGTPALAGGLFAARPCLGSGADNRRRRARRILQAARMTQDLNDDIATVRQLLAD
jgi:hypothetical protein